MSNFQIIRQNQTITLTDCLIFREKYPEVKNPGIVLSTHGSPAHIELQLVQAKKLYPSVPILVRNDGRHREKELLAICKTYNVEYSTTPFHLGWQKGDLFSFYDGLSWAEQNKIDFLIKISRRLVPLINIVDIFVKDFAETDNATIGSNCIRSHEELRTDCIGMYVPEWIKLKMYLFQLTVLIGLNKSVETTLASIIKYLNSNFSITSFEHLMKTGKYFGKSSFVSNNRYASSNNYLWHMADKPIRYLNLANTNNLSYTIKDF